MKTRPLRIFVQRTLLVRLAAATAAIALVTAALTYFYQRDRLERQIADIGRQGAAALVNRVMDLAEQAQMTPLAALHQVLESSAGSPAGARAGRFVFVQFYDRTGRVFAEEAVPEPGAADEARGFAESRPLSFPERGRVDSATRRGAGRLFVHTALALEDRQGASRGYVRGVFAVSGEAEAEMESAVLRSILLALTIVCGVSAILYPVILRLTRRLADYSTSLLDANLETLAVLGSAIAKRDADTDAHNYRVSLYAARLGEEIGLSAEAMRGLIKGAFIHDVGKLGIPDAVLLKPGRLDPEEFRIMQTHVEKGVDIVTRASWLRDSVPVVAAHHEKFGGGGYPKDAKAEEIPLAARIFAVADVFDALTSRRPYKDPLGLEETLGILERGRGSHFDPALLDAFGGIAGALYRKYAGQEGEPLRRELVALVDRYFSAGIESVVY
jgi:HD-GYP domain-containing protein (c-di-GMP phosphodiesterase class II)